jgi:hypothetical protein
LTEDQRGFVICEGQTVERKGFSLGECPEITGNPVRTFPKPANLTNIRGSRHDLGERTRMAFEAGLVLRKRTMAHLATLSTSNEYHVVSYTPELMSTPSQMNRVMATVDELSRKVRKALRPTAHRTPPD